MILASSLKINLITFTRELIQPTNGCLFIFFVFDQAKPSFDLVLKALSANGVEIFQLGKIYQCSSN